ncbi:MAG: tetraacyldisaccharide 4'-kinase [Pseudomonadota bacterium]
MHRLERHWYRITPLTLLLWPLSVLFRGAVALRRALYRSGLKPSVKLPVPVIVVGNISVGGTGKTPLVLWLAEFLHARGKHPGIVSRGYGSDSTAVREVRPDSDARQVGDEPLLLARRSGCPVWAGADRVAAAQALLRAHPECDALISDDGLQHYRLQRDAELAVVDGARRHGNGLMLPAGPLREPRCRLHHVDAVMLNGGTTQPGEHAMTLAGKTFYNLRDPARKIEAQELHGKKLHAIAGIGHPQRFFDHLRALGLDVVAHPFPDHHAYIPADLDFADAEAILMTEKDAVKCSAWADVRCWALAVNAQLDPKLGEIIMKKLEHRNGR